MIENPEAEKRFVELVSFVRNEIGEDKMPIARDTLIENDLRVTGDDAEELIVAFSKKYNVDVSQFLFTKYFYNEAELFVFFSSKTIAPFTIGHLEKAIVAGRLDENVING